MKMSEYFNLFDFDYNLLSDSKIKQLVDLMKKKYVSCWNQTLQHSRKLSFYHPGPSKRTIAILFTLIDKISLDERVCPFCSGNKIEDETHLLLDYQKYSSMRDIFLSKIETKIDDIRKL